MPEDGIPMPCKNCIHIISWTKNELSGIEYDCAASYETSEYKWADPDCPSFRPFSEREEHV